METIINNETAKAMFLPYRNQKCPKSICIRSKSNGTCEKALHTNTTIVETRAKPKSKQMVC